MIALVDCNNFFVSCERVVHPDLRGVPVVVAGSNDGCVVAMSDEAKALGIGRGVPVFKIRDVIKAGGVHVVSGDHHLYGEVSRCVMKTLSTLEGKIHVTSIDEAFIEVDDGIGDFEEYGRYIVSLIMEKAGVPVSIGFATTRTLAKIATGMAKKWHGFHGACLLADEGRISKALELTPIKDVWGIGRRNSRTLMMCGISTAMQFARLDLHSLRSMVGNVNLERTWRELRGEACIDFGEEGETAKSVSATGTFPHDIYHYSALREYVCRFASVVGRKLRSQQIEAAEISVFIATNRFHTHLPQHNEMLGMPLDSPTNYTPALLETCELLLKRLYRAGYGYKRAGVVVQKVVHADGHQASLFDDDKSATALMKRQKIMEVADRLNLVTSVIPASESGKVRDRADGMGAGFAPVRPSYDSKTDN